MRIIKLVIASALLIPALAFAQGEPLPRAGLTPENPFYFLDRLGETVREFLTLNPENKARLHVTFAAERVAEIKVILETKGVEAPGLTVAQERLETNIERATELVKKEKEKGKDVSVLAGDIVDNFHTQRTAAKQAFEDTKRAFADRKKELREQFSAAVKSGDTALVEKLRTELISLEAAKDEAEAKKDAAIAALETEKEKLQVELEEKKQREEEARKAAEQEQERLEEEAERALEELEIEDEEIEDELLRREIEKSIKELDKDVEKTDAEVEDIDED